MSAEINKIRFAYNRVTNEKYAVNGCIPSNDAPTFGAMDSNELFGSNLQSLPQAVDLRRYMTAVENQSQTNSCVANAIVGALEYLLNREKNLPVDMSRLFVYYNARLRNPYLGGWMRDVGCHITDGIKSVQNEGTCTEASWQFHLPYINMRPHGPCYGEAKQNTVTEAIPVAIDLESMKKCLAEGYPFVFGLVLYGSFHTARTNGGWVPMPSSHEGMSREHGRHAMLAVGYNDQRQVFVVRNSWGPQWGDEGYCYIPYPYMTDSSKCFDAFAIRRFTAQNLGRAHWLLDPSQMRFGIPKFSGGGQDDAEENWTIVDEDITVGAPVDKTADSTTEETAPGGERWLENPNPYGEEFSDPNQSWSNYPDQNPSTDWGTEENAANPGTEEIAGSDEYQGNVDYDPYDDYNAGTQYMAFGSKKR